jgi:hypothetical protein
MAEGHSLELHLDRRWFLIEPWKAVFAAAVDLVWRTRSSTRIVVPPMSEAWLRQHHTDVPKHSNENF